MSAGSRPAVTLPDFLRPNLRVLVCGLNPSPWAVRTGLPFGRPGNRFWPASLAAGLVPRDRDVGAALAAGVGFTDLCKRPTRRAAEIGPAEYRRGRSRIEALERRYTPRVICFVGLSGYRLAFDRKARAGAQRPRIGDARVYLVPSTSGLNAHETLASLTQHLRRLRRFAESTDSRRG